MDRVAAARVLLLLFCIFMPKQKSAHARKPLSSKREDTETKTNWELYEYHDRFRSIPNNDSKDANIKISKVMTCSDVFLVTCRLKDNKILEESDYKEFFVPTDDAAFPSETFVQRWGKREGDETGNVPWEDDFKEIIKNDRKFVGCVESGSPNYWIRDANMQFDDNVITPCTTCFERADYGNMLVDAVFKWKCFPPLYPRHTLHYNWFVSIDALRNNIWTFEEYTYDEEDVKISKSIEINTLVDAMMSMLKGLRERVRTNKGEKMTIVDEIYLTEQLCNVLFGLLYIVKKESLTKGKWYEWGFDGYANGIRDDVEAYEFTSPDVELLPKDVKNSVLTHTKWTVGRKAIQEMMTHCIGMDFNLPYLRFKELRENNTFVTLWPKPEDESISKKLEARPFPLALEERSWI